MKKNQWTFGIIAIFAIVLVAGIVLVGFGQIGIKQQGTVGLTAPLQGFLFPVDDTWYLVRIFFGGTPPTVIDEKEIKQITGLTNIYPPAGTPSVNQNQARNIARTQFNEYINEARGSLENFNLQQCINDCKASQKTMIDKTCEQYCNLDYRAYLQSNYDEAVSAELKDPVLVYGENGEPASWAVPALGNVGVIAVFEINPVSGAFIGGSFHSGGNYVYDEWLSEGAAKEILINYLAAHGISYSKILEGRRISYPTQYNLNTA